MRPQLPVRRAVPVLLWRRGVALGIDAIAIGLVSGLLGGGWIAQGFVFVVGWLLLRVVVVSRNKGQSLGRWALDMRIIALPGGTPTLMNLTKREGLLAIATFFAVWGITHLSPTSAWVLLLLVPLGVDASIAYNDPAQSQTAHDRYGKTCIVESRRGYSLDVKIRRLVAQLRTRVRR